jgi:probable F420-dependent oxidoreductase
MKLGVVFPQTEITPSAEVVRDYAQAVEDLGYDYLLAYEHVLGANPERPGGWSGPYTHRHPFLEPFVLFAYLAGQTRRLHFATGILILPQRQTVLVAKQAATLDVLCGGRLRLGIGIGWNAVEYEALGQDFGSRGRRIEEQVSLLRRLWTEPLVTFQGRGHTVSDAGLNPLPVQRPIPIWFGGAADPVLRRMARLGDGWMPNTMPPEQGRPLVEALRGYLAEAGRDPAAFGIDVRLNLGSLPQPGWEAYATAWRALGATHLCVNTMGAGLAAPQDHIAALQRFKSTLGGLQD